MKVSVLASAAAALAMAAPAGAIPADFKAKADALLKQAYPAAGPGAAVIVTDDGRVVYEGARGLADIAANRPITAQTVFRMGSITKQFSAAIMLQLAAEGKLSLDDKLSKFLPDFPKPGADATVAQLLNHTVGVQSYTNIPGWMVEKNTAQAYTTEEMIAQFKDLPSPSKPGEKWDYNNSGYVLVGAVIEQVTGKPWYQNVEERIARPLGLKTIRYGVLENETPNMAAGYTDADGKVAPAQKIHMSVPHAAGALIGSVEDLAKWNAALHHGKVIPQAYYARMIAPTRLPDGTTNDYGFGIRNGELRGHKSLGHGGGIFGFSTDSLYLPKEEVFVAVFTNSDSPATDAGMVMLKLAALAVDDPFPTFARQALDAKAVEPWFGLYKLKDAERRVFLRDGKLFTQRTGGGELEAFAAGDGRYFYPNSLTWFELRRDASGTPVVAMYQQGAVTPELAARSGPIPAELPVADVPRSTLERYVGAYDAPMGKLVVALPAEGPMTVQLGGQQAIPVAAVSQTEFRTIGVDARIEFLVEDGKVIGAVLKQGGREMPAKRAD
jgi:CubicO group peptidase (beta-lactamase class C family)